MKNEAKANEALNKRMKKQVRYSKGEEIFNVVSHLAAAAFAVALAALVIVFCSINAFKGKYSYPALAITSVSIYGATLILMFLMSTLYHSRKFGTVARSVFCRFDHCSIALLIAGTYMPFTLIGLVEYGTQADFVWGIVIASIVLAAALVMVVLNAINVDKFRRLGVIMYLVMGWAIVMRIYQVGRAIGLWAFIFLLLGGVFYSAGVILYRSKKINFNHAIWHIFVVAGAFTQFASIFFFII